MLKKKLITAITLFSVVVFTIITPLTVCAEENEVYWPKGPKVDSASAIVMEANT